jgi:hypothetical protein
VALAVAPDGLTIEVHAGGSDPAWAATGAPYAEPSHRPPTLTELARTVQFAAPESRADFAWIALDEMAQVYAGEVEKLTGGTGTILMTHPHARWMRATQAYAANLRGLADAITPSSSVEIRANPPEPPILFLAESGASVALSRPRIGEPDYMGRNIVVRYCEIQACPRIALPAQAPAAPPAQRVVTSWSFAEGRGPTCSTSNGLAFRFADARRLIRKQYVCLWVAEQLQALSRGLRRAAEAGTTIEWDALSVQPMGDDRPERIILNRRRDYLVLDLPALGANEALQRAALPWVKARALGRPESQSFPHAERLLADLIASRR